MYEDTWYSFVPEIQPKRGVSQNIGHRRRESLLQQPNVGDSLFRGSDADVSD